MPVLPPEPWIFPDDLLTDPEALSFPLEAADNGETPSDRWWALHTRPRAEKALSRRLLRERIPFFLPLQERRRRLQRRLVRSSVPLFPGYLFLRGSDDARRKALETNLVVGSLHVADQVRLTSDLVRVYDLINSGEPVFPEERLQPGMPAEIINGPLAGLRGTVVRRQGTKVLRFVVEVDFLQRGTSVEIDSAMVQPV